MVLSDGFNEVRKPNYKFKKEDFGLIKSVIKLLKKYGFERDEDIYKLENYFIKIIRDELVFQKMINEEKFLTNGVYLTSVLQISFYDLSFYYNDNINNKEYVKDILYYLKYDFENELKTIIRKNKIKRLL